MRKGIKSALSVFITMAMLVCSLAGIPVMAEDGISIECVDGEIVVSGSFTGTQQLEKPIMLCWKHMMKRVIS